MGGADVAAGERDPEPAPASRPSPIPTRRRARSTTCGATAYNLQRPVRDADAPAIRGRRAPTARRRRQIIETVRADGPHDSDRVRIEASCWRPTAFRRCRRAIADDAKTKRSSRPTKIGYPVVLKLFSRDDHAQDRRGRRAAEPARRRRRCATAFQAIETSVAEKVGAEHFHGVTVQPMIKLDGYEVILGSSIDPQFGPVLLFGMGGQLVEVFKDRALALPPLNTTLARRMMEQTKIYTALKGVRGRKPVDLAGAGAAAGALQPAGGRAALDQGNRHQPAAGLAGAAGGARCARGAARAGRRRGASCRGWRSGPIRSKYVAAWTMKDGDDGARSARSVPKTSR